MSMIFRKFKSLAWKMFLYLHDKLPKKPTDVEQKRINQLRSAFLTLPEADETVSSDAERIWSENLNRLRERVINSDPRLFLRWDVVRETMFVGNADYIGVELAYLKSNVRWQSCWKSAIQESEVGFPEPYFKYIKSSGNLIHHAYHLARFEVQTGKKIGDFKNIFEFGGGYGSMCRLVHKLGFKGKYVIYDLPHFSRLQKYYLSSLGLNVLEKSGFSAGEGICCVDDKEQLTDEIVRGDSSLFIATWSLSESPVYVRAQLLPEIGLCQAQLVAYQAIFGEVDNIDYFKTIREFNSLPNLLNQKIEHLPGSYYLFGWST